MRIDIAILISICAVFIIYIAFRLIKAIVFKVRYEEYGNNWVSDGKGGFIKILSIKSSFNESFLAYFVTVLRNQTFQVVKGQVQLSVIKNEYPYYINNDNDRGRLNIGLALYLENNISQEEVLRRQQENDRLEIIQRSIISFYNPVIVETNKIEEPKIKPEKQKIEPKQELVETKPNISRIDKIME